MLRWIGTGDIRFDFSVSLSVSSSISFRTIATEDENYRTSKIENRLSKITHIYIYIYINRWQHIAYPLLTNANHILKDSYTVKNILIHVITIAETTDEILSLWPGNANVASQIETKILYVEAKHAVVEYTNLASNAKKN